MFAKKKPTTVEVHRWTRNDGDEKDSFGNDNMARWLGPAFRYIDQHLIFKGVDGRELVAKQGDYVARQETLYGPDFWPISPITFGQTYEVIGAAETEDQHLAEGK